MEGMAKGPSASFSKSSKAAMTASWSCSNQALAALLRSLLISDFVIAPKFSWIAGRKQGSTCLFRPCTKVHLPCCLSRRHGNRNGDIQRAHRRLQGNDETRIGGSVDLRRHTRRFAACKQDVAGKKSEIRVGKACLGRQQHQPPPAGAAPGLEGGPMGMAGDLDMSEVVHASPAEVPVAHRKTSGFDDRGREPEAGAHPQDRAGVLWDIGLIKRTVKGASP